LPAAELPAGIPADERVPLPPSDAPERLPNGHFVKGARSAQSKGGKASAGLARIALTIGADADERFKPYKAMAVAFRKKHMQELARDVGGGYCGTGPSTMVESAARQYAASQFLFDTAGTDAKLLKLASQLGNDSRQNILAAFELCAKEATARRAVAPNNHAAELERAFGGGSPKGGGG
jgi:hypothetical protein